MTFMGSKNDQKEKLNLGECYLNMLASRSDLSRPFHWWVACAYLCWCGVPGELWSGRAQCPLYCTSALQAPACQMDTGAAQSLPPRVTGGRRVQSLILTAAFLCLHECQWWQSPGRVTEGPVVFLNLLSSVAISFPKEDTQIKRVIFPLLSLPTNSHLKRKDSAQCTLASLHLAQLFCVARLYSCLLFLLG